MKDRDTDRNETHRRWTRCFAHADLNALLDKPVAAKFWSELAAFNLAAYRLRWRKGGR